MVIKDTSILIGKSPKIVIFSLAVLFLRAIAGAIKASLRKIDLVSRLAGDEFSIILPETEHEQAIQTIGRIKKDLTRLMKEKARIL